MSDVTTSPKLSEAQLAHLLKSVTARNPHISALAINPELTAPVGPFVTLDVTSTFTNAAGLVSTTISAHTFSLHVLAKSHGHRAVVEFLADEHGTKMVQAGVIPQRPAPWPSAPPLP